MMKRTCLIIWMIIAVLAVSFSALSENEPWDCPDCGRTGNTGNFCGGCGHTAPSSESSAEASGTDASAQTLKRSVTVGDILKFGHYEQDNNLDNGPEAIEWIVLDYDEVNHKALLLSKDGIDVVPYNEVYVSLTWENSTLRGWLNDDFLNQAFSKEEQSAILVTNVDNGPGQGYSEWDTNGGNNTQDRIFLLSYAEANQYLDVTYAGSKNTKASVAPNAYTKARGAYTRYKKQTDKDESAVWWWLRSPGEKQCYASLVVSTGEMDYYHVHSPNVVARPALWLNLESDIS